MLTTIIATGFAALIATSAALAQASHTVTIPFTFEAGGTEHPGGAYEVRRMGTHTIVQLTNVATGKSVMVPTPITIGTSKDSSPKLVFRASGDQHSLAEVWLQDSPGMKTDRRSKAVAEEASVKVAIK